MEIGLLFGIEEDERETERRKKWLRGRRSWTN